MFPVPRQRWVDALPCHEVQLGEIRHLTLIVHGRVAQVISLANSLRLLELIGPAQLYVFGQCGHWTQIEHAAVFNALVERFRSGENGSHIVKGNLTPKSSSAASPQLSTCGKCSALAETARPLGKRLILHALPGRGLPKVCA